MQVIQSVSLLALTCNFCQPTSKPLVTCVLKADGLGSWLPGKQAEKVTCLTGKSTCAG